MLHILQHLWKRHACLPACPIIMFPLLFLSLTLTRSKLNERKSFRCWCCCCCWEKSCNRNEKGEWKKMQKKEEIKKFKIGIATRSVCFATVFIYDINLFARSCLRAGYSVYNTASISIILNIQMIKHYWRRIRLRVFLWISHLEILKVDFSLKKASNAKIQPDS